MAAKDSIQPLEERSARSPQRRWLMVLRLAISTFLLISFSLLKIYGGHQQDFNLLWLRYGLGAIGLYYVLSVLFYFVQPKVRRMAILFQALQVVADLALTTCLIMITGGAESPFSFLFLIVIINSAFLGGIRTALVVATFSAAIWGGLITLQDIGSLSAWLPELFVPLSSEAKAIGLVGARLVRILISTSSCYLVAFLSGYLAGQLFLSRTALVKSQAHLGRLEDLNESIIQSIDSGLVTMDHNGLILTVNQAGLEILGWRLPDVLGRPWQLFLPQLEHVLPLSPRGRAAIFDTGGLRFEYERMFDNRELILELNVLALVDKNGEIWGRLLVVKDLTSLSHMEDAVRKAEHLAALGELAAGLAHELRTPLASMTGAWHMLSQQTLEPEDQSRLINIIGREMERLAKLTNDFLSFARPAHSSPKVLNLNAVVSDQLKVFESSLSNDVTLVNGLGEKFMIYFDQDQLSQIIWNLLSNAVDAGKGRPDLRITVETGRDANWPRHAVLRVIDNGAGIPYEALQKIFEPFFTTKSSGNGLGLPIVSRILHEGNGHITVASSHRSGTIFSIMLPLATDE